MIQASLISDINMLKQSVAKFTGSPNIKSSDGKIFFLNDNLNVVELLNRITNLESQITINVASIAELYQLHLYVYPLITTDGNTIVDSEGNVVVIDNRG